MSAPLASRQACAKVVHDKMLANLIQFSPAHDLKLADILCIARMAQTIAFDAFSDGPAA